jgi:hypothetical protein
MEIVSKFHRYPGYKPAHEVPEDEVTDMIVSGCPHSWEKAMILQGFDVVSQPIDKVVEFLERLETTEAMYENTHKRGQPKSNRAQKGPANKGGSKQTYSSDRSAPQNKKRNMRFCPLHNAKKMRASWVSALPQSQNDVRGKNKYRRSDAIRREKDLNALVEERVKKSVDQAMRSALGKKKRGQADETDYESELNFDVLKVSDPDNSSDSD